MTIRGGRYEIIRVIASGGMAKVYLGRALGAGGFERLVAIKAMHAHLAAEPEFIDMFLDEARLAARIRHPNVVATLDVQQDEEGVFLVMEYVEGPTLMAMLREARRAGRKMPVDIALRVMHDCLAGLHAAHELTGADGEPLNLVHRDVSPANILLGVDGITRITDFGVARAESRLTTTRSGEVKGKVPFLSPEQIRRDPIDRRTDIYAAGVVLWEALAGERLIRGDNDGDRLMAILNAERRPLRDLNPDVPEALEAAVLKALAPAAEDRFPTAAAFAEAIEDAAQGAEVPVAAPRVVAAHVRELKVHESPGDVPSSRSADMSGPRSSRALTGVGAPGADLDPPISTHAGAVAAADLIPKAKRKSRVLPVTAGLVVIAAAGAGLLLLRRPTSAHNVSAEPQPIGEATSATATDTPPGVVVSAALPAPTVSAAPPDSAAPAAAGSDSAPVAAAKGQVRGGRPAVGTHAPRPDSTKGDAKPTSSGRAAPSPTSFRPKEL